MFQSKLTNQYPVRYKREKRLFLVFSGRDIHNTELCSINEFKHSLILLNFTPSDSDFRLLINEFKSEKNMIYYMRFISRICDETVKLKCILNPF
jgi:Ca2+-binding EF-hand superfamily protein